MIVFILECILNCIIRGIEAGKGWNGVGGDAFVCLRLLPVLFHKKIAYADKKNHKNVPSAQERIHTILQFLG